MQEMAKTFIRRSVLTGNIVSGMVTAICDVGGGYHVVRGVNV